jgi:hypothetical protein
MNRKDFFRGIVGTAVMASSTGCAEAAEEGCEK